MRSELTLPAETDVIMSSTIPSRQDNREPMRLNPLPEIERGAAPLPMPLASFVGREQELADLRGLTLHPAVRLLTLTGPGGVGKTRLALRVAEEVGDAFADGVAFVPLASLGEPGQVLPVVARALGIREGSEQPPERRLAALLRERQTLLLLDNLEHLLASGPELGALLAACPRVTVLATSRSPLGIYGEQVWPAPPLRLPEHEEASDRTPDCTDLLASDAVRLFVERARAARPSFALTEANAADVAAICERLDGLPLAIELAATRAAHLSPAAIRDRLDQRLALLSGGPRDQPARLRSLRDAIGWSYDLLPPEEQVAFRRLGIFAASFGLDEAQAVIAAEGGDAETVLGPLQGLLDHSLVQEAGVGSGEPRFRLLETVRDYAREQLSHHPGEPAAARERHAAAFLALAERAEPELWGTAQGAWLDRLEDELPNLRAARDWFQEAGDPASFLSLAVAMGHFWSLRGYFAEGREWLERALAAADGRQDLARDRSCALYYTAALAYFQGDDGAAGTYAAASIALCDAAAQYSALSFSRYVLALIAQRAGDLGQAEAHYEGALATTRARDDHRITGYCLMHLGRLAEIQGDLAVAACRAAEGLAVHRANGDRFGTVAALLTVAQVAIDQDDLGRAGGALGEALALLPGLRNRLMVAETLEIASRLTIRRGHAAGGTRLWAAAAKLRTLLGVPVIAYWRARHDAAIRDARAALGEDGFAAASGAGAALSIEDAIAEASIAAGADAPSASARPAAAGNGLTRRELDVLRLLVEGRSDKEIAAALFVSPRTATTHVTSILGKLGVTSRTAAAAVAVRRGLA